LKSWAARLYKKGAKVPPGAIDDYLLITGLTLKKGGRAKNQGWAATTNVAVEGTGDPDGWVGTWDPFLVFTPGDEMDSDSIDSPISFGDVVSAALVKNAILLVRSSTIFPVDFKSDKVGYGKHCRMFFQKGDRGEIKETCMDKDTLFAKD
jgi:hypothetical protein